MYWRRTKRHDGYHLHEWQVLLSANSSNEMTRGKTTKDDSRFPLFNSVPVQLCSAVWDWHVDWTTKLFWLCQSFHFRRLDGAVIHCCPQTITKTHTISPISSARRELSRAQDVNAEGLLWNSLSPSINLPVGLSFSVIPNIFLPFCVVTKVHYSVQCLSILTASGALAWYISHFFAQFKSIVKFVKIREFFPNVYYVLYAWKNYVSLSFQRSFTDWQKDFVTEFQVSGFLTWGNFSPEIFWDLPLMFTGHCCNNVLYVT